ncbi:uncharacterized protein Z519_10050 [Cladophialophora bantiana CBS 173.52]|uniref:Uncharacterized protein n=1 Tax=Cladophialophora bantiana (strain ATCC 10958 / CBS 173.52 / CDC B-1940 / NIH 8579) TaxID=1442370 RepID=A0A0D2H7B2_CLAB1|nr:uncharacterized protein Z519_10050 [Cladophialophora bantiana CBS 173.52]KIW89198.1 hypothetical protein Z519_10050 [Cladophialophora bantiana CBS 173.52]
MSTNPFRKSSSLKGPGGSSTPTPTLNLTSDPRGTSPGALSLDTRVHGASQKHVNFASPPAIPISPVSYPPSPESTRQEFLSTFPSPKSPFPAPTDYSQALASDPFAAEASDEDDSAIEEALENAKASNEITAPGSIITKASREDAVKETLGRFASAPRRLVDHQSAAAGSKDLSGSSKSIMDVDAFKRMLLTGDRGSSWSRDTAVQSTQSGPNPVSDSGSSADTASISQHSIFETVQPAHDESPRTSDELDASEVNTYRAHLGTISEKGEKPPPPKSRRGKTLKDSGTEPGPTAKFDTFINSLSLPSSRNINSEVPSLRSPPIDESPASDRFTSAGPPDTPKKVPPAPPVTRRKSQQAPKKPVLARSSSSRYSVFSETDGPPSPSFPSSGSKPPPPPPARRANSTGDRRPSLDVTSIPENANLTETELRPGIHSTPSYLKRMSQGLPPPLPPPRRGRGSSRSSMETTRPPMAHLGMAEAGGSDMGFPKSDPRDILADLAALQREVDAARAGAGQ